MSRSSRPDSSPEALRRSLHPEEYPCYDLEGVYKYTPGCRGRCCFTAGTPEGEDSPKWKATLAARQEDAPLMAQQEGASPLAQPNFESPKKIFIHDKSSGITPPDACVAWSATVCRPSFAPACQGLGEGAPGRSG